MIGLYETIMTLNDKEKDKIYKQYRKDIPKNSIAPFIAFFGICMLAMFSTTLLPMIGQYLIEKKGMLETDPNLPRVAYVYFLASMVPFVIVLTYLYKRIEREFNERVKAIKAYNHELYVELFDKMKDSKWKEVVEKGKDLK